ncbi:carbon-monoxide dehydrogenase small subunit [Anaerosphaera aminiphila DSM 21120]|uniref:Carbon-monoxide dehydrogenase small subunit n=1 Tax=Anaerosphaera aminiphila DSM 21120 TaxID=1120995 RepID=A0A1M5S401_9FIRM|nr:2Fe-2S iron-sulfur cluster-binding protein [Anaerosphaera aminiphila]SHH33221.1 carbon-monoxide dehydrogenase small subunit [Anaerosphaera aminiphila DSM 21120]
MKVNLNINKKTYNLDVAPDELLLNTIRNLGFKSVKRACETSNCGLCSVLIDDLSYLSCTLLTVQCEDKNITTLEGIGSDAKILSDFIAEEGADQCGYCSSGFIINTVSLKKNYKNPSDEFIKNYLSGNLCRCTGYESQMRAIKKYLEV